MVSDYLNNTSKYVYPLLIHEKNKDREIITYNLDQNGLALRSYHEAILIKIEKYPSSKYSYAYKKGLCTKDAIKVHLHSKLFIKLDIKSFFESIKFDSFIEKVKQNYISYNLLQCCFYNNHLSLGFVTSPRISDMYLYKFDLKIEEFLKLHSTCKYSRYCDDILISTTDSDFNNLHMLLDFIKEELKSYDLTINLSKLREFDLSKDTAVSFLGLNLTKDNKITISKKFILKTLDVINDYYKKYSISLISDFIDYKKNYLYYKACSMVSYIKNNSEYSYQRFLKKHNNKFGFEWNDLKSLNKRYLNMFVA